MQSGNNIIEINKKPGNRMVSGVMLLTLSTLICKIIGLLFKIPIINIVGIDGMAYFSAAYNVYMVLNSLSAAGLPIALSILVSRSLASCKFTNVKKVFRLSLALFLLLGVLGTLVLYFGADYYSEVIGINEASLAVKAIAPTLLFICISGAIRGYFQGYEFMTPTAISQLIESIGKLLLGVGLAYCCVNLGKNSTITAAAAVVGLSAGVMLSVVYLTVHLFCFNKKHRRIGVESDTIDSESGKKILRDLFIIAFPITVSSCITSLTGLADTALITNRLIYGGFSTDAAVGLYSSYTNLAIPLFNLPPALITSIGISLIPALSGAVERGALRESQKTFSVALRLCCLLAIPSAAGLAIFAKPILCTLYPNEIEACTFAAPLLSVLSAAIVFSCLITVCNATLQSYMKQSLPIVSMAIGAVVKIVLEYILVGTKLGIYGAPISTVACTFTILILDLVFIMLYTPQRISVGPIARIFASSVFGIGIGAVVYYFCSNSTADFLVLMVSIFVSCIMYAVFSLLFGAVTHSDIAPIKILKPIADILIKYKLIKS